MLTAMTKEEIMAAAMNLAKEKPQILGTSDYFITLEQLERILKSFEK